VPRINLGSNAGLDERGGSIMDRLEALKEVLADLGAVCGGEKEYRKNYRWISFSYGQRAYRILACVPSRMPSGTTTELFQAYGLEWDPQERILKAIGGRCTLLETLTSPNKWEGVDNDEIRF